MTEKTRKTSLPVREVGHRRLEDYAAVTGPGPVEEIRELAAGLKGKTVLHLNSSPSGGGVADIFEALIPLLNDVGVEAEWRTIRGEVPFFDVTKSMHNSLQGKRVEWTAEMWTRGWNTTGVTPETCTRNTTSFSSTILSLRPFCTSWETVAASKRSGFGAVTST